MHTQAFPHLLSMSTHDPDIKLDGDKTRQKISTQDKKVAVL